MKILHWKRTTIANAPDELSKAITKYSGHDSQVQKRGSIPNGIDVVHFHNTKTNVKNSIKSCIQYHSEPHRVNLRANVDMKMVISQYHATLSDYSDCVPVRNIIDFNTELYDPLLVGDKIRVAFSPSSLTNNGYWYDKGYIQTKRILKTLKSEYPKKFDYDLITKTPLKECIERKKRCNIVIDECVTPSYHRSGLEGLALGKMTICFLHDEVKKKMLLSSGADHSPFHNVYIGNLYSYLKSVIEKGVDYVNEEGEKSLKWMQSYWNPKDIVDDFIKKYQSI